MIIPFHTDIKNKLARFIDSNSVPHLLFYGPSGSGKMTIVEDFLRKIYQTNELLKTNVMYVNCAHGKGIKFIREDLKFFARLNIHLNGGCNFKTIILMNAEQLTIDAQSALRRCIEIYSKTTRFFIIVKNKEKLLHPIVSRFCEIYIPYPETADGEAINLHTYSLKTIYTFEKDLKMNNLKFIDEILLPVVNNRNTVSHKTLCECAIILYERSISSLDVIDWIINNDIISVYDRCQIQICYSKIRSEFRCEKLIMLYMIDFLCNRINIDLINISFL